MQIYFPIVHAVLDAVYAYGQGLAANSWKKRLILYWHAIVSGLMLIFVVRRLVRDAAGLAQRKLGDAPLDSPDARRPFISFVVPVFNAKPRYLNDLLASFQLQRKSGAACELVLSDDGSTAPATRAWLARHGADEGLRVLRSEVNGGIAEATNRGVAVARGDWIGFLDHDDALAPFATALIAQTLSRHPDCQFLYTDEIIADERLRPVDCFLKPAFDPVLLSGVNYINHLALYRRARLLEIGGLRPGFEGSQDYDLVLRYTAGLEDKNILHLPYPAYLWRRSEAAYSIQFRRQAVGAARRALAEHYAGMGAPAMVGEACVPDLHRLRFDQLSEDWPLVSVVIPSRDRFDLISRTLKGLMQETDYPKLEIIVVDNGSTDSEVLDLYDRHGRSTPGFRAVVFEEPFNFARSVNRGLAIASGSMILLLNNDVEVLDADWLKEMVSCMRYDGVGVVGAKLLYPDRSLQHAGVIVGFGDLAGHWFVGTPSDFPGPMGRLWVRQQFSAVTGACMLVSAACAQAVGTFDEHDFAIAYNDVDFCLRAKAAGYKVLWTPFASLLHQESATRGSDVVPEKIERFQREQANLRRRHATHVHEDRAVSPWLSKDRSIPVMRRLSLLPEAR